MRDYHDEWEEEERTLDRADLAVFGDTLSFSYPTHDYPQEA